MKFLLRTAIISILVLALLAGACGSIRWARRGGAAAGFAANALMLTFGMGLIPTPPQRGVQQVQEQEDRTGAESGDPPSHG
jgi:hypothetical protein